MPPKFFLTLFSCFALSLITIGVLSGGETDSSDEATLGGKIKEMANSVFDAMEAAGKEIDEALGERLALGTAIRRARVARLTGV